MKKTSLLVFHVLIIILLTIFTQVGGLIWVIACFISAKTLIKKRIIFPLLYLISVSLIIPPIAKHFGRVQLPVVNTSLKPHNYIYPLLYRNYVKPKLLNLLITASTNLEKSEINITYLDANFPFLNGFPLLPHISHNDGKKIDIAFQYKGENNKKNRQQTFYFWLWCFCK